MSDYPRDPDIEQRIDAYIKGRLNQDEIEQLWVELLKKPHYIDLLETELGVKTIIEEKAKAEKRSKSAGKEAIPVTFLNRNWKWMAAAAAVALLILSINLFQVDNSQILQQMALSDINIAESLESAPVLRSEKAVSLTPADSLLNLGFKAALLGEVERALEFYNQVIERGEDGTATAQAYINIGIIRYNADSFGKAATAFRNALDSIEDHPGLQEKAQWYLGNAYIHMDRLEDAREAIYQAYAADGIYRKPAFRLLRKLDYELGNIDAETYRQQTGENE